MIATEPRTPPHTAIGSEAGPIPRDQRAYGLRIIYSDDDRLDLAVRGLGETTTREDLRAARIDLRRQIARINTLIRQREIAAATRVPVANLPSDRANRSSHAVVCSR